MFLNVRFRPDLSGIPGPLGRVLSAFGDCCFGWVCCIMPLTGSDQWYDICRESPACLLCLERSINALFYGMALVVWSVNHL